MKRKADEEKQKGRREAEERVEEEEEEEGEEISHGALQCSGDVCQALLDRYAKSSAPQHCHLCASAAAMRSILQDEGLPLTPPAYLAAAVTSLPDAGRGIDPAAAAALAAFLSVLLPLVPGDAMPPAKAREAAFVLAGFLKAPHEGLATGTVRSVVKSLGFLLLRVDLGDWDAVGLPLETLIEFTVDRRPKVRRCAQAYVEKVFRDLKSSIVTKKASKVALCMYRKYVPSAKELNSIEHADAPNSKKLPNSEHMGTLHMLNVLKIIAPNLSEKVKTRIFTDVCKLFGDRFSLITRNVLQLMETLLKHTEARVLATESENIISVLTSYIASGEKNPIDTIISSMALLKNGLNKFHDTQPSLWISGLPLILMPVAGYLVSDVDSSKDVADILKELICLSVDRKALLTTASRPCNVERKRTPEIAGIISICSELNNMLNSCDVPTDHMLAVISVLFLKLGELSNFFMKEILLKLSQLVMNCDEEMSIMKHLQECIGSAIISMGPENVLSLIPISLNKENLTCSNTWLIPILKKYVVGASLQFFMEHIVPLAQSLHDACDKVKKASMRKALQSCVRDLWDLLPSFCRYPTDTYKKFDSLAEMLIVVLRTDPSLHKTITQALQILVNENRYSLEANQDENRCVVLSDIMSLKDLHVESRSSLWYYSKKIASKNIKALASCSMNIIWTLTEAFFDSPPEKRAYLKEAIGCLAALPGSVNIHGFFVSLLEKFDLAETMMIESTKLVDQFLDADKKEEEEESKKKQNIEKRCLLMELAFSLVEVADEDLINIFFDYIRSCLSVNDGTCQLEAFSTLSKILKEHHWFYSARIDEIMDLFQRVKTPVDFMILRNRLSCYHFLLVHMLKSKEENVDTKAFLILNEIILTLKSKKESRKLAYNILLTISCSLKNSQSRDAKSFLQRLFNMVMGYLSSSSPHIVSGAISALSLLIYNDADFCLAVPNLIPSVLVLLQNKDNEVIKAALGFVKVLVSSLHSDNLMTILPDVVNGILPWSAVSKYHFRSKVGIIFEILIRKCGFDSIDMFAPEKYKTFLKSIAEGRRSQKSQEGVVSSEMLDSTDSIKRGQKRALDDVSGTKNHSKAHSNIPSGMGKKNKKGISIVDNTNQPAGKRGRSKLANNGDSTNSKSFHRTETRNRDRSHMNERAKSQNMKIRRKMDNKNQYFVASVSKSDAHPKFNERRRLGKMRRKMK